jgi:hypothetical protein
MARNSWLLVTLLAPLVARGEPPPAKNEPPKSEPAPAAAPDAPRQKVGLLIDGGGEHRERLTQQIIAKLKSPLDAEVVPPTIAPTDEPAQMALRASLGVARLVIVKIELQGKDRYGKDKYTVAIVAVDEKEVHHRFTDAGPNTLVPAVVEMFAKLPPMPAPPPPPEPAKVPEVKKEEPPPPVAAPAPAPQQPIADHFYRRKHPYSVLVAGAVFFFAPYFATVGVAANYQPYNKNAAMVGYIPLAGPFLAIKRINEKDLNDGYRIGLTVDGVVQVLAFNLLVAGAIYCGIGEKRKEMHIHGMAVQPLVSVGPEGARMGASLKW